MVKDNFGKTCMTLPSGANLIRFDDYDAIFRYDDIRNNRSGLGFKGYYHQH